MINGLWLVFRKHSPWTRTMSSHPRLLPGAQGDLGHKDNVNRDILDAIYTTEVILFSCTEMFISTNIWSIVLCAGNERVKDTGLMEERPLSLLHITKGILFYSVHMLLSLRVFLEKNNDNDHSHAGSHMLALCQMQGTCHESSWWSLMWTVLLGILCRFGNWGLERLKLLLKFPGWINMWSSQHGLKTCVLSPYLRYHQGFHRAVFFLNWQQREAGGSPA